MVKLLLLLQAQIPGAVWTLSTRDIFGLCTTVKHHQTDQIGTIKLFMNKLSKGN